MFYLKKITKQDATRTPLVSSKALSTFFNIKFDGRDSEKYIDLFIINSEKSMVTLIKKKQDNRIYLDKKAFICFIENSILVFQKSNNKFSAQCFSKLDKEYGKLNELILINGNNYITKKL